MTIARATELAKSTRDQPTSGLSKDAIQSELNTIHHELKYLINRHHDYVPVAPLIKLRRRLKELLAD